MDRIENAERTLKQAKQEARDIVRYARRQAFHRILDAETALAKARRDAGMHAYR